MTSNELMAAANLTFGTLVAYIRPEDWQRSTPCTEWDVRALVNHVAGELSWVPDLVAGRTIEEVGSKYDGDVLGNDPKSAWLRIAAEAETAFAQAGALERTVHLSFGDFSAKEYLEQTAADVTIHAWDLAKGLGRELELSQGLIANAIKTFGPYANRTGKSSTFFGRAIDADDAASPQEKMLGLFGRQA